MLSWGGLRPLGQLEEHRGRVDSLGLRHFLRHDPPPFANCLAPLVVLGGAYIGQMRDMVTW